MNIICIFSAKVDKIKIIMSLIIKYEGYFRKKVKFVELMIDTHSDTVSLVENKKSLSVKHLKMKLFVKEI